MYTISIILPEEIFDRTAKVSKPPVISKLQQNGQCFSSSQSHVTSHPRKLRGHIIKFNNVLLYKIENFATYFYKFIR